MVTTRGAAFHEVGYQICTSATWGTNGVAPGAKGDGFFRCTG